MKRLWYVVFATMLALGFTSLAAAGTMGAAFAAPGHSAAASACQKGGFASLSRSDGSALGNVGACVSYAAQGGTLESACQPGSWSTTGVAPCTSADVGYYVDSVGATSETPCPLGETTAGTGSTSESACYLAVYAT